MNLYFLQIIKVKKELLNFNKLLKLNDANNISLEELLSSLSKKVELDLEFLGPFKYILSDVNDLSEKINQGEAEIHHSLEILKQKQDEIGNFIINANKMKFEELSKNKED